MSYIYISLKSEIMKTPFTLLTALAFCVLAIAQEDHSEFIEGPFSSPQEVTETCLLCHDGIDKDLMKTRHWNWLGDNNFGKQNLINSYCVSLPSNWPR